jgi:hypothetical protein
MMSSGTLPAHSLINFLVYYCNHSAEAKQGSGGRKKGTTESTWAYLLCTLDHGFVILVLLSLYDRNIIDSVFKRRIRSSIESIFVV